MILKKLGYLALLVAAAALGGWLLQTGFGKIQALRQLERVPAAQAAYVLPGEVTLNATAVVDQHTTGSYYTQTPSLFYHYTRERKTVDSDGKTQWRTEFRHTDGVDFLLEDLSGHLRVRIADHADAVQWSLRQSFVETHGDIRHTEWRLEPGDKVFVFGKAELAEHGMALHFDRQGAYNPILSHYSQASSQSRFGNSGLWTLWGGLSCLAIAVFALAHVLGVHRILAFVSLLGVVQMVALIHLSLLMIRADLRSGIERFHQQNAAAESQAAALFNAQGLTWNGWQSLAQANLSAEDEKRLRAYQRYLAINQQRLAVQMNSAPERWLLPVWELTPPAPIKGMDPEDEVEIRRQLAEFPQTHLPGLLPWIAMTIAALVALIFTWTALRTIRVKRLIENLTTSPTRGVSCGLTEICGEIQPAEGAELLTTPYFATKCLWYLYKKEEKRGAGKNARWHPLEREIRNAPFFVRDAEGQLPVQADNAEVITRHVTRKTVGKLRYTQAVLKAGDPIYAVAVAAIDPAQPDRLMLRAGDMKEPFILSNYAEQEVMLSKASSSMLSLCAAVSGVLLAVMLAFGIHGSFSPLDSLIAAAVLPIYMLVIMLILHYNDLIFLRQRALRNWANIDVSLKKRKDLIDALAKTAQTVLQHERNLLQKLSLLRAALTQTQGNQIKVAEYLRQEKAFQRLLRAVAENYPDLKSRELMQRLMTVISDGETEIALLRQGYNDAATAYNTRITSIPDIILAKFFYFRRLELITE